jgi:glucokinase
MQIRELKTKAPRSDLVRLLTPQVGGEARHLRTALQDGDKEAQRILRQLGEDLAFGLSHVVHLFHPEIIILGGGLAGVGEPLRAAVEEALDSFLMRAFAPGPRIALSVLGSNVVPTGALLLAGSALNAASSHPA